MGTINSPRWYESYFQLPIDTNHKVYDYLENFDFLYKDSEPTKKEILAISKQLEKTLEFRKLRKEWLIKNKFY